jgi:hypothetical protein
MYAAQPSAPLTPLPTNWRRIKDVVAVYAAPLDKYGRVIIGAAPVWTLFPRWARELYREMAELSRKSGGNLWPSYEYIGKQLMAVTPERARQQILALENWGFIEKRHRTDKNGWYATNHYGLVDPVAPYHVIAIACRTYKMRQPLRVFQLAQQGGDVPDFRPGRREDRPRIMPAPQPVAAGIGDQRTLISPVILPGSYRRIAEAAGLVDPRHQADAWGRYKAAKKHAQKKIRKPGAYFTGICQRMVQEIREAAALAGDGEATALGAPLAHQVAPPAYQIAPQQLAKVSSMTEEELLRRRQFIVTQAFRELMAGADPGRAAAEIFRSAQLLRYCRLSPCPIEQVVELVHEAYSRLQPAQ